MSPSIQFGACYTIGKQGYSDFTPSEKQEVQQLLQAEAQRRDIKIECREDGYGPMDVFTAEDAEKIEQLRQASTPEAQNKYNEAFEQFKQDAWAEIGLNNTIAQLREDAFLPLLKMKWPIVSPKALKTRAQKMGEAVDNYQQAKEKATEAAHQEYFQKVEAYKASTHSPQSKQRQLQDLGIHSLLESLTGRRPKVRTNVKTLKRAIQDGRFDVATGDMITRSQKVLGKKKVNTQASDSAGE